MKAGHIKRAAAAARTMAVALCLASGSLAAAGVPAGAWASGFLGVEAQSVDGPIRAGFGLDKIGGVVLRDLEPHGPAADAGLQRSDVILGFQGAAVQGLQQLVAFMAATEPGQTVRFEVWRDGTTRSVDVALGPWPDGWQITQQSAAVVPKLGLELAALTVDVRRAMRVRWGTVGVAVMKAEGPSAAAGVQPGDVVVAVGRRAVVDPAQVDGLAGAMGEKWFVLVDRGGAVLLLGPGVSEGGRDGGGVLVAELADGPYVMDVALGGPVVHPGDILPKLPKPAEMPMPAKATTSGMTVAALTPEIRKSFDVRWSAQGVVVIDLEAEAMAAGLQAGDVIRRVGQEVVRDPEHLRQMLDGKLPAVLLIERPTGFSFITIGGQAAALGGTVFNWNGGAQR